MAGNRESKDSEQAMGRDPLGDEEDVLGRTIFGGERSTSVPKEAAPLRTRRRNTRPKRKPAAQPSHYKVISISMYNDDIEKIDAMVKQLKKMGHTKANRSALIRFALDQVDIEKMPRSY